MLPRLVIVGGGPIGLEMAVAAVQSQQWEVTLVERGSELCANVVAWEHVQLFSAWALNTSDAGRAALLASGVGVPDGTDYPTGREFLDRYLRPLGAYVAGRCRILLDARVVAIGKAHRLLKGDLDAGRRRAASFRTLVARDGEESIVVSEAVVDASGTYGHGNWLGQGGIPALGEQRAARHIIRTIPNVAHAAARYLNHTTAVVGSAFSAITTIKNLQELAAAHPAATVDVHWCTRRGNEGTPLYEKIDNDPLPQRASLSQLANSLARSRTGEAATADTPAHNFRLWYHPHVQLESISGAEADGTGTMDLVLSEVHEVDHTTATAQQTIEGVRTLIANVGFRPDTSLFRELQVHQCYATEGPMKLAAALLSSAGAGSVDCLQQVAPGKATMENPEPSFYIVGMKSYGRSSKFLLTIGHEQVRHVLELLNEGIQPEGGERTCTE